GVDGERHTSDVVVAAYRKPEYSVEVTPARERYLLGEEVEMTVGAKFYFGAPVAGAKVKYEVFRSSDWRSQSWPDGEYDEEEYSEGEGDYGGEYGEPVGKGEAVLDGNGEAIIRFKAAPPDDDQSENEYEE